MRQVGAAQQRLAELQAKLLDQVLAHEQELTYKVYRCATAAVLGGLVVHCSFH